MIELTDSHCHLEAKDFTETKDGKSVDIRPQVIERAQNAGVTRLVCIGSGHTLEQVDNAIELTRLHQHIWSAVAIHPHDARVVDEKILQAIEERAKSEPRVVA